MTDALTLGIYFIDQYNFQSLYDSAEGGDATALALRKAVMNFVDQGPQPTCALCRTRVSAIDVPGMTIIVCYLEQSKRSLTSWVCEDCAVRDDLDDNLEHVIRQWPALPENCIVEIISKTTLH